jgi:VWFA-related protein
VIDDLHIIEADIEPVKRILAEFARTLARTDEVAVTFVGRSDLGSDFTHGPAAAAAAVDRISAALGFGLDAGPPKPMTLANALSATQTLKNVVEALADPNFSRRLIVYVSAGSVLGQDAPMGSPEHRSAQTLRDALKDVYEAASRANVAIYTLDPRGLVAPETAVRGTITSEVSRKQVARRILNQHGYLAEIATNTMGRSFVNQSDVGKAVASIVEENSHFYLLGYRPYSVRGDGRFNQISVRLRTPGLKVRARRGYPSPSPAPPQGAVSAMKTVLSRGTVASGLPLRVVAAPVAPGEAGIRTLITAQVLYPVQKADNLPAIEDTVELSVMALDADGRVKTSKSRRFQIKARPKALNDVTFLLHEFMDLAVGPARLRVGIGSDALNRIGSVHIPIDVPRLASDVEICAVVLGFAGPPREPSLGADVVAGLVPFEPTTQREFAGTDVVRLFVVVSWPRSGPAPELEWRVRPAGGASEPVLQGRATVGLVASPGFGSAEGTLRLANLRSGSYILEIRNSRPGQTPASHLTSFSVR